ncbi:hypothetical protein BJ944DRAFT_203950 [Cunninghamella echinulata]|nr:hypothetical protein BJ944DRAFT_203950 [Cunninghamella echinulata]
MNNSSRMIKSEERNQRLLEFIRRPISGRFLQYVIQQASLVIPCRVTSDMNQDINSNCNNKKKELELPSLPIFIQQLIKRSCVKPGTLLAVLVFLDRLQRRLAHLAKGMPCTCHRIFLATLIVTSKSLHDTSPKNKHWARYAIYFNLSEINLMEQQLLSLVNYQLIIAPEEIENAFTQYEIFKSQHHRNQNVILTTSSLSTPHISSMTNTATSSSSSFSSTCKSHPLLQHSPAIPPASITSNMIMHSNAPTPIEPRVLNNNSNNGATNNSVLMKKSASMMDTAMVYEDHQYLCSQNATLSIPSTSSSNSISTMYPNSRILGNSLSSSTSSTSIALSSTTSLSSIGSSQLCTPSHSSTSLNVDSMTTSSSNNNSSLLDQDPILFYPPAHLRDNHRIQNWNSLWHNHSSLDPPSTLLTSHYPDNNESNKHTTHHQIDHFSYSAN